MNTQRISQILTHNENWRKQIVDVDEPTTKLVIFSLGSDWFAFPGEAIHEILTDTKVYYVPGCPAEVEGVMNVRGDIESVIYLHALLGIASANSTQSSKSVLDGCILLAEGAGMRSGIRVDRIIDVTDVPVSAVQVPPSSMPEHERRRIKGLLDFSGHPVAVLDAAILFSDFMQAAS